MITRKQFLAAGAGAIVGAPAILSQTRRANIVFILADDHAYDFMSNVGHPWAYGQRIRSV